MPTLYVIATPIGNLEDISLRALRILNEVALIAAEDTRTTRKLLRRYEIRTPLTSYNEHNHKAKAPRIVDTLGDDDVALVSEAGTPTVRDPGMQLIRAVLAEGFSVIPIPGPSAVMAALAASGFSADQFMFLGFLPSKKGQRQRALEQVKAETCTLVAFETPHRLRASLKDGLGVLGDRQIAIGREITKLHEEWFRGTVSEALEHFTQPRGEFTLVIEGAEESPPGDEDEALEMLRELRAGGSKAQEAVTEVSAALKLPRRTVYRLWLSLS
jgi:16S rRNA (cytidine1402-2'-O)-methyltransferase